MWSTEKTLGLIELLHSSPVLWDASCVDYKNKLKKADAVREIANTLSVDESEIEKKIKALKVQFRREHLKLTSLKKSGASPKKYAWFGYKPLLFLLQGRGARGSQLTDATKRQIAEVDFEQETDAATRSAPHQDDAPQSASKPRPSSTNKRSEGKVDETFQMMKSLAEHTIGRDEYHVFGENVAHKLRNCGRSRREVSFAQHKINEIIFNLEMGCFGEDTNQFPEAHFIFRK
ncbi:uncharacterized protein LOC135102604 [Scylla paramamosain]